MVIPISLIKTIGWFIAKHFVYPVIRKSLKKKVEDNDYKWDDEMLFGIDEVFDYSEHKRVRG